MARPHELIKTFTGDSWLRYITGWLLFGVGVMIFLTGIAKGGTIVSALVIEV